MRVQVVCARINRESIEILCDDDDDDDDGGTIPVFGNYQLFGGLNPSEKSPIPMGFTEKA